MTEAELWQRASDLARIAHPEPPVYRSRPLALALQAGTDPLAYWGLTEAIATLAMQYARDPTPKDDTNAMLRARQAPKDTPS